MVDELDSAPLLPEEEWANALTHAVAAVVCCLQLSAQAPQAVETFDAAIDTSEKIATGIFFSPLACHMALSAMAVLWTQTSSATKLCSR